MKKLAAVILFVAFVTGATLVCSGVWRDQSGGGVDLDPSFENAIPGRAHARADEVFDALPERLFHHVAIRIRVEEYDILMSGAHQAAASTRNVLTLRSGSRSS